MDEMPLWLSAGAQDVFAVLSHPARPNGAGVVLVHSGVLTMSAHTGRIWVRTARSLAAEGYLALRIDLSGSGDSTGAFERRDDGQPVADTSAAVRELQARGARSILLAGHCFGAVPAMGAALEAPAVRALVLVAPPLTWVTRGQTMLQAGGPAPLAEAARSVLSPLVLRRLASDPTYRAWLVRRARRRAGVLRPPAVVADGEARRVLVGLRELDRLTAAGTAVRILYGEQDALYRDFERARADGLATVLARPGVDVEVAPGFLHNLDRVEVQDRVGDAIERAAAAMLLAAG